VTLVTVGYVALALGRTVWTVDYWERIGLLPQSPFLLRPGVPLKQRRLYPAAYVKVLGEIAQQDYVRERMERSDWPAFQIAAFAAYEQTVRPLLTDRMADGCHRSHPEQPAAGLGPHTNLPFAAEGSE
jgi:hypothetical protein